MATVQPQQGVIGIDAKTVANHCPTPYTTRQNLSVTQNASADIKPKIPRHTTKKTGSTCGDLEQRKSDRIGMGKKEL